MKIKARELVILELVFEFVSDGDLDACEKAKTKLKEMAKYYNTRIYPIGNNQKPDLKKAYFEFLTNGAGYCKTISNLFNSL